MSVHHVVDGAISRIAASQDGVLTRRQALAAGATPRMIAHRVSVGQWIRVGNGVYRLAGARVTWRQRARAACLIAGPGAVVSHRSAGALYVVSGIRPGRLEITVPEGRNNRNPLAIVHRSAFLTPSDSGYHGGIAVTLPARMLCDLTGRIGDDLLEEIVDDVLCRRLASLEELTARAEALRSRRGSRALMAVLAAWQGDGIAANVAEMRIVRTLLEHGLPLPVRQFEVHHRGEFIARVDLAMPDSRVALELESFRWHAGRRPFRSDRARRNRLEAAGWHVLQATTEDAYDGTDLCAAVEALVCHAGAA